MLYIIQLDMTSGQYKDTYKVLSTPVKNIASRDWKQKIWPFPETNLFSNCQSNNQSFTIGALIKGLNLNLSTELLTSRLNMKATAQIKGKDRRV